jgi:hypothetical protein
MAKMQHYVPRTLTKGFALRENDKLINIYLLNHKKTEERRGRYEQGQRHYLYGSDQVLEKAFEGLEIGVSPALNKLRSGDLGFP